MKNLKNGFSDEEILKFHWESNSKEIKQKYKVITDINISTIKELFVPLFVHLLCTDNDDDDEDDDDDDDDDDDELFLWYGWPTKDAYPYFQPGLLSEILTIANFREVANRIWICAEPEFRLIWMNLCSSDNHYTIGAQHHDALFVYFLCTVFVIHFNPFPSKKSFTLVEIKCLG